MKYETNEEREAMRETKREAAREAKREAKAASEEHRANRGLRKSARGVDKELRGIKTSEVVTAASIAPYEPIP